MYQALQQRIVFGLLLVSTSLTFVAGKYTSRIHELDEEMHRTTPRIVDFLFYICGFLGIIVAVGWVVVVLQQINVLSLSIIHLMVLGLLFQFAVIIRLRIIKNRLDLLKFPVN